MKRLEIFRAGKHIAANGQQLEFTRADLDRVAKDYNAQTSQAPIVVGHPRDNGPAYGWIRSLSVNDNGVLEAEPEQVDESFAEMVKAGRFKKRSASFYPPGSAQHPAGERADGYYLRHVGFLGAAPPAVKGLADPQFNDSPDDYIEFGDAWAMNSIATILKRMRDAWIEKFGVDEADKTFPEFLLEDVTEAGRQKEEPQEPTAGPAFNETPSGDTTMTLTPEQIAELQKKADSAAATEAELQKLKAQQADFAERAARLARQENEAVVDTLIAEGKVIPGLKSALLDFACDLDASETVEFGEGDGSKLKGTRRDALFGLFKAQPKLVEFNEQSHDRGTGTGGGDLTPAQVADRARTYRKKQQDAGKTISFTEAVGAVNAGQDLQ